MYLYPEHDPDWGDNLATPSDAMAEYARNIEAPADQAWILTDYDVWVRNPRYVGPPMLHPDFIGPDDIDLVDHMAMSMESQPPAGPLSFDDDIPF